MEAIRKVSDSEIIFSYHDYIRQKTEFRIQSILWDLSVSLYSSFGIYFQLRLVLYRTVGLDSRYY